MTTFRLNPSNVYDGEGRPWYDTKEGIEKSIKTLNDFLRLRHARHFAGYESHENLNQIYVLGDYSFDTCGNCSVATPSIKKKFPNIPDVLTHEEYWTFLRVYATDKEMHGVSFEINKHIPPAHIICPSCGEGWTLDNMDDVLFDESNKVVEPNGMVGKTLLDLKKLFAAMPDAQYYVGYEPFLQNDRFIDLSPWTDTPRTELERKMVKNERGWVGKRDGITDDYVIESGDKVHFSIIHFYHHGCYRKNANDNMLLSFQTIFEKAGIEVMEALQVPNEYCACPYCASWYIFMTEIGKIKIGWRKRVINIDWESLELDPKSIKQLFMGEDVTKSSTNIHAWSDEKAIEYLSKLKAHVKG